MSDTMHTDETPPEQATGNWLWRKLWGDHSKWGKFGVIFIALLVTSILASIVTRIIIFEPDHETNYRIALIAPLSGEKAAIGSSLQRGAELYVKHFNKSGGFNGQLIELSLHDSAADSSNIEALAEKIRQDPKIIAAIGPWSTANLRNAATVFDESGIATLTLSPASQKLVASHPSLFSLTYSQEDETGFLANYMRNVVDETLVSVISDTSTQSMMAERFKSAFERFGIPIRHHWSFDSQNDDLNIKLSEIASEVKKANNSGALYLAMGEREAAKFIKLLRANKASNKITGPHLLGTRAFTQALDTSDYETYTHGLMTAAPLMFDTANQNAQKFRNSYISTHRTAPDWIAALSYESALVITQALSAIAQNDDDDSNRNIRKDILGYLAELNERERGIQGITGNITFDSKGKTTKPIQVGIYDGQHIVSAPTQLQPIGAGEVTNYIQAVREGKSLYVNDRFMYKTSVVYSGIKINEIRNYDPIARTFEMDFVIWFRYRGNLKPEDVIFRNAVEPIKLEKPDKSEKIGGMNYRRYNVSGKFNANFLDAKRDYGSQLFGTSFRHRSLNRNNLLYVVDLVGLDMAGGQSYADQIQNEQVLSPSLGMKVDQAWISQDIIRSSGFGSPNFVGHGKPVPDFSQMDVGLVVTAAAISLRDFIDNEYLIYLLIFAVLGSIFAIFMDKKKDEKGLFWNLQSWILRAISWPLLLVAAGSLILDYTFNHFESHVVDIIVPIYESGSWVIGAILTAMALKRFVWTPLETRTGQKVPGSVRGITTIVIFIFASFGIIAFVFHQDLTSLLATSGVIAMITGLALQSNISNIFSGIALNLERPFGVGDYVTIGGDTGQVTDITWRTIRIQAGNGEEICVPNSKATEMQITKVFPKHSATYELHLDVPTSPSYLPQKVCELIEKAALKYDRALKEPVPQATFSNISTDEGVGIANYHLLVVCEIYDKFSERFKDKDAVMQAIWAEFEANNMLLQPNENQVPGKSRQLPFINRLQNR